MNRKLRIGIAAVGVALGSCLIVWLAKPTSDVDESAGAAVSALTVDVAMLQKETWSQTVQVSGALTAWQEVIVSPETGGLRIAELLVDIGAKVNRGQALVRLADESLQADRRKQEAAVAQARAYLEQAASNLKRAKVVSASGALSEQQLEEYRVNEATARAALASAQAELDSIKLKVRQTHIVAPDDGVISSKSGVLGNVVGTGDELYRMVRQGRIEWRPELDARQVAAVRKNQAARLTLPNGEQVEGEVRLVGPTLSTDTGRATVYVSLPLDSAARAGMFANGNIELDSKAALTLPQSAVVLRDGRSYVYAVGAGDKVISRLVTTGRRQKDRIEVLTGIDVDTRVVASGGAFLSEGAQVTVTSIGSAKARSGGAK